MIWRIVTNSVIATVAGNLIQVRFPVFYLERQARQMKFILATIQDGRTIRYTPSVLDLLKTDPDVVKVVDADTGEIIYTNEQKGAQE